jgi:hypothetical protein
MGRRKRNNAMNLIKNIVGGLGFAALFYAFAFAIALTN